MSKTSISPSPGAPVSSPSQLLVGWQGIRRLYTASLERRALRKLPPAILVDIGVDRSLLLRGSDRPWLERAATKPRAL